MVLMVEMLMAIVLTVGNGGDGRYCGGYGGGKC